MNKELIEKWTKTLADLSMEEDEREIILESMKSMGETEAGEALDKLVEALRVPSLDESLKLLEEFGEYEGTEVGELWATLLDLYHRRDYLDPESKLIPLLEEEIINQATWAKQNFELVEEAETYTRTYTHKILREI